MSKGALLILNALNSKKKNDIILVKEKISA